MQRLPRSPVTSALRTQTGSAPRVVVPAIQKRLHELSQPSLFQAVTAMADQFQLQMYLQADRRSELRRQSGECVSTPDCGPPRTDMFAAKQATDHNDPV